MYFVFIKETALLLRTCSVFCWKTWMRGIGEGKTEGGKVLMLLHLVQESSVGPDRRDFPRAMLVNDSSDWICYHIFLTTLQLNGCFTS